MHALNQQQHGASKHAKTVAVIGINFYKAARLEQWRGAERR